MRLAIVHYHLRKGGVTRVISSTLDALQLDFSQVVVLSSTATEEPLPCPVEIIPQLRYTDRPSANEARELHAALVNGARRHLGGDPDIWHIHNHCLGKNVNFPEALRRLIDENQRCLLQVHDFSEDGRPENFSSQFAPYKQGDFKDYEKALFPVAPQIGYAVLNGRDRQVLIDAGVPECQVFWLPNAVIPPKPEGITSRSIYARMGTPFYLYPTRAIRRKNLGELLLLASSLDSGSVGTTLTPKNPRWIPIHDKWRKLARQLDLPVEFGLGERPGNTFNSLINASTALVSTSVGEGFGLSFLEPWLLGKSIIGRDLPEVTGDFKENGVRMPGLYNKWNVPTSLLDLKALRSRFQTTILSVYQAYGRDISSKAIDDAFEQHTSEDHVDFGFLDETAQEEILRNLQARKQRLPLPIDLDASRPDLVDENRSRIADTYGLPHYRDQLNSIYQTLMESDTGPINAANPSSILKSFIDPRRFSFLRS